MSKKPIWENTWGGLATVTPGYTIYIDDKREGNWLISIEDVTNDSIGSILNEHACEIQTLDVTWNQLHGGYEFTGNGESRLVELLKLIGYKLTCDQLNSLWTNRDTSGLFISENTLKTVYSSIKNLKEGKVSSDFDLDEAIELFKDVED